MTGQDFQGVNAAYVAELYDRYRQDPASVDPASRAAFDAGLRPPEGPQPARASTIAVGAGDMADVVGAVKAKYGCGVLVIEHNMAFVMGLCERIHVLDGGRTIAAGTPAEIRANAEVRRAYLGTTAPQ